MISEDLIKKTILRHLEQLELEQKVLRNLVKDMEQERSWLIATKTFKGGK